MANEKRLISADVAKEMIVKHANEFSDVLNRREKALLIGGGTSCIDKCPTVDAVEVVRCGECRFVDTDACPMSGTPGRVSASDFCSYGERRTK